MLGWNKQGQGAASGDQNYNNEGNGSGSGLISIKKEIENELENVCRVCLAIDGKMYAITDYNLHQMYQQATGVYVLQEDNLPQKFCWECAQRLINSSRFRSKALKTHLLLSEILSDGKYITKEDIEILTENESYLKTTLTKAKSRVNAFNLDITFCDVNLKREISDNNDDVAHSSETSMKDQFPRHFLDRGSDNHLNEIPVEFEVTVMKKEIEDDPECMERSSENMHYPTGQMFGKRSMEASQQNANASGENFGQNQVYIPKVRCRNPGIIYQGFTSEPFDPSTSIKIEDGKKILERKFACPKCPFKGVTQGKLNIHLRTHTGEKPYKCDYCDFSCAVKCSLVNHTKAKHTMEKNYSCHICNYKCVSRSILNVHLRKHTGEKPYRCEFCGYRCAQKGCLDNHIKSKHTKEKNFECHLCDYKSVTKDKLKVHLHNHSGERPYKCDFCDYTSTHKDNLRKHIKRRHLKEKNFSCTFCEYTCFTKERLNIHVRSHTGERPFACDLCDYSGSEKSALDSHIKFKHTKEKNFSCDVCDYKTVTKEKLNIHQRTHTGEKPFTCHICDYKSAHFSSLKLHLKSKHETAKMDCD